MLKVKIFTEFGSKNLEEKINAFISNIDVVDLKYSIASNQAMRTYSVLIMYN